MKIQLNIAYAVYNLDYSKDYRPLAIAESENELINVIKETAKDDEVTVNTEDILKYGEALSSDDTIKYGIEDAPFIDRTSND